jgi:hypothetical protein
MTRPVPRIAQDGVIGLVNATAMLRFPDLWVSKISSTQVKRHTDSR